MSAPEVTAPVRTPKKRHRRSIPSWVVVAIGAVATGVGLLWSSTLYDQTGEAVLDEPAAKVLVALLGAVGTILVLLLQRQKLVEHELKPNSGGSMRDSSDRAEVLARRALEAAEHATRAARKASEDTMQLREDVQGLRADHTGTASDIRGIRKDIGRITDALTEKRSTT